MFSEGLNDTPHLTALQLLNFVREDIWIDELRLLWESKPTKILLVSKPDAWFKYSRGTDELGFSQQVD